MEQICQRWGCKILEKTTPRERSISSTLRNDSYESITTDLPSHYLDTGPPHWQKPDSLPICEGSREKPGLYQVSKLRKFNFCYWTVMWLWGRFRRTMVLRKFQVSSPKAEKFEFLLLHCVLKRECDMWDILINFDYLFGTTCENYRSLSIPKSEIFESVKGVWGEGGPGYVKSQSWEIVTNVLLWEGGQYVWRGFWGSEGK